MTLLPQPGLADKAHDLAAVDVEVDAVDGPDDAVAGIERGPQAADLEQRPVAALAASRRRGRAGTISSMTVVVERRSELDRSAGVSVAAVRSPVEPRVQRVAQAVAEEVEASTVRVRAIPGAKIIRWAR